MNTTCDLVIVSARAAELQANRKGRWSLAFDSDCVGVADHFRVLKLSEVVWSLSQMFRCPSFWKGFGVDSGDENTALMQEGPIPRTTLPEFWRRSCPGVRCDVYRSSTRYPRVASAMGTGRFTAGHWSPVRLIWRVGMFYRLEAWLPRSLRPGPGHAWSQLLYRPRRETNWYLCQQ